MAGVIQGKFYVAGGGSDKLDIYDPGTNLWSSGAPLPSPRAGGGAAVLGAKLYVIGGFNGEKFTGEVLAYNPVTNRWITKAPLPTPRHFLAADRIVVGGQPRVVAVGGRLDLGATNETDLYAP
jgi:N-acetylneuraminic acid mutarotase